MSRITTLAETEPELEYGARYPSGKVRIFSRRILAWGHTKKNPSAVLVYRVCGPWQEERNA